MEESLCGKRSDRTCIAIKALYKAAGGDFMAYNDTHTHAEVLAMFDKAIEEAEA